MEKITRTHGLLHAEMRPWRPWVNKTSKGRKTATHKPYERASADGQHCKVSMITHPVKLFWPKSQCFDYLYQEAEILLQNYPVQATICLCEDTHTEDTHTEDTHTEDTHTEDTHTEDDDDYDDEEELN